MLQNFRPVDRRARCSFLGATLIASAALAVALVANPAGDEASAQSFLLPGLTKNSRLGGNSVLSNVGKSNWAQRTPGTGKPGVTAPGGPSSGVSSGAGGNGAGRTPGKRPRPIRPPEITGGGGGVFVIEPGQAGAQNLGGGTAAGGFRRPGSGVPPANDQSYRSDEVLIELAANTSDEAAATLARKFRLTRLESFEFRLAGTKLYLWRIPDRRPVPAVIRALEADRSVISASPNRVFRLNGEAAAMSWPPLEQYALAKLQVPQAHALARGAGVLVAVIDGGVDISHPELVGVVVETFDAIGSGDKLHAHGTAVAGAIAARGRLTGTAPAALILAARAFGSERDKSDGTTFHAAKAIDWAVERDARIINMSFSGPPDRLIETSLKAARAKGIVLVAAAGNAGPHSQPLYPAAYPYVIAVTATDPGDRLFHAANRGTHIAVAAPGVDLWLPALNGTYQETSGTSFAAAEVSGTVALLIELRPDLGHDQIRRALMSSARDLGPRGIDPQFGAGLVDAYQALLSVEPATVGAAPGEPLADN